MAPMMGILKGLLKVRYAVVALLAAGAWQVYEVVKPAPPPLEEPRREAVDRAVTDLVRKWPESAQGGGLLVVPFERDETGYVTSAVRYALQRADFVEVKAPDVVEKLYRKMDLPLSGTFDGPRGVELGKAADVQYVLIGKVARLSDVVGEVEVNLMAELWGTAGATRLSAWTYEEKPSNLQRTVGRVSPLKRALGWLSFIILLPWALYPLVRAVLRTESNVANALMLLTFVAVGAAAAWVALAGELSGWAGAFFVVALAFETAYNAGTLNVIAGWEK